MTKAHITLSIDSEIIEAIRSTGVNMSKEVNDYFKTWLVANESNTENLNIELTRLQLEKNLKKLNHYQVAVKSCRTKLDRWEEQQKEMQEGKLQKEKEDIESMNRCVDCGNLIPEVAKRHKFPSGAVCNACFLTSSKENIRKWNGET